MTTLADRLSLPLFAKELLEQAARRRTYVLRVVYGLLLFVFVLGPESRFFQAGVNPMRVLGQGRSLFEALLALQLGGIALFLPALMSGRITQEKERDSLVLLMLTDLSPTQIILQKFLAGLMPMLTFLLLGLPLAGVAYSFGGVTSRDITIGALVLTLSVLQVGALSLWCSALFRNTVGAFLGTYFIGLVFYGGPPFIVEVLNEAGFRSQFARQHYADHFPMVLTGYFRVSRVLDTDFWMRIAVNSGVVFLFLGLAIYHLPRRAFAPPKRTLKRIFGWFDRVMSRVNRVLGNVLLGRKSASLPANDPVAWRTRHTSILGKPNHLVRVLVALEVVTVGLCLMMIQDGFSFSRENFGLSMLGAVFGTLAVLVLAVVSANVFVTERISQSLEVLLTTPLSAAEIVRQKSRSLTPLMVVLAIPLVTIFGFEALAENDMSLIPRPYQQIHPSRTLQYVVTAALTLGIYLPLVKWLALWIGLMCRTRTKAIFSTLAAIIVWCVAPYLIFGGLLELDDHGPESVFYLSSPLTIPAANEVGFQTSRQGNLWVETVINFAFYGAILFLLRRHCFQTADRHLRR